MFKRLLSFTLAVLLINMVWGRSTAYADSKAEEQARFVEQVKAGVAKLGTGTEARVEVKLRDKGKLRGYISEAGADHFVVTDVRTGAATTVAYTEVRQVKGNNLSTGAKIGIGVAIGAAILVALFFIGKNVAQ
jgi:VIT1/CCC1 family predicted Fe2+/Mn2+ transporter